MANMTTDALSFRDGTIGLLRDADGEPDAPFVCLLAGREDSAQIRTLAQEMGAPPFSMAVIPVEDWEDDLSPWRAPGLRGGRDFGGGADAFLRALEAALPAVRAALEAPDAPCYLAGYSLAGLFSVYALYRSAAFSGAASVSGSLWFPGFSEFAAAHEMPRQPDRMYFSLGDRESRTRDPLLRRTEDDTRALCEALRRQGVESVFERNPGGHFQDAEKRLARGLAWITRECDGDE